MTERNTKKRIKKWLAIVLAALFALLATGLAFCLGVPYQLRTWKNWQPDYEKLDITALLEKENLLDEEYETLYRQTGLTRLAIDDMRGEEQGRQRICAIQKYLFDGATPNGRYASPIMYIDETSTYATLAYLQDGDILVTATTVVSWWRFGHAALVVDADKGLLLESIGVGVESKYNASTVFCNLANFMVLRPKASAETKAQVVAYARANLSNLPYSATIGILSKKNPENIRSTQCAHLVWYAYKRFGIELDSNGGGLVVPKDIANCKELELVQAFGFNLDRLWK